MGKERKGDSFAAGTDQSFCLVPQQSQIWRACPIALAPVVVVVHSLES